MLSKFPNKTLKIGAKVSLSPQSRFRNGEGGGPSVNPIGVVGEVVGKDGREVFVSWPHKPWVNYMESDYDLIAEGELGFLEIILDKT